jgi:hypothetical protein
VRARPLLQARGEKHIVFCFATREDADQFAQKFDGEQMTPATRPPWIEKRKKA